VSFRDGIFGRLKIVRVINAETLYLCECGCGRLAEFSYYQLANNVMRECLDCYCKRPHTRIRHGLNNFIGHRRTICARGDARWRGKGRKKRRTFSSGELFVWIGMTQRCLKPYATRFPQYGARGIRVCERWLIFKPEKRS
jgi:hypothetical protein